MWQKRRGGAPRPHCPWSVTHIRFDPALRRLDINLDFPPGSRFVHPDTGQSSPVYDTLQRTRRHLNFFPFECYVNAFVPHIEGGPDGVVKQVPVPWARPQSGFTLLLESLLVLCARTGMTVANPTWRTGGWKPLFSGLEHAGTPCFTG